MKEMFRKVAAWTLAVCMCVSCVSGALAFDPDEVIDVEKPATIGMTATATGQGDGNYKVTYDTNLVMSNSLAKVAAMNKDDDYKLSNLRFVCELKDTLVSQLNDVNASDISFSGDGAANYEFVSVKKITGGIEITYKLKPSIIDSWKSLTLEEVGVSLMKSMTMTSTKAVKKAHLEAATGITETGAIKADVYIIYGDGSQPIPSFGTTKAIHGGHGETQLVLSDYDGGSGGAAAPTYEIKVLESAHGSATSSMIKAPAGRQIIITATPDKGYRVIDVIVTDKDGNEITVKKVGDNKYAFSMPASSVEVTVKFAGIVDDPDDTGVGKILNTSEHIAYMFGDNRGTFRPDANITRAEVAQAFYNLLIEKNTVKENTFNDVPATSWYADAINTMAKMGIVNGLGDGNFEPDRAITRAEFATVAARFAKAAAAKFEFNDVPKSHWAYSYVSTASSYGWIVGAGNNMFQPNRAITRTEFATIVNRMLGRLGDKTAVDQDRETKWPDVFDSHWGVVAIAEATTYHDCVYNESFTQETWTKEYTKEEYLTSRTEK